MPESSSSHSRRSAWGFWVPLTVTVAVATLGVAAFVLSQRESEEEAEPGLDYEDGDERGPLSSRKERGAPGATDLNVTTGDSTSERGVMPEADSAPATWGARMSGALGRTPSPQQFFDSAGKSIVTGISAATAAVGNALQSIREEDKTAFQDHETWSEEADAKYSRSVHQQQTTEIAAELSAKSQQNISISQEALGERPASRTSTSSRLANRPNRKTVAIVVSADFAFPNLDDQSFHEQASILSHIPKNLDFEKTKLYILIYAPCLKEKDQSIEAGHPQAPPSVSSSFSNIAHEQAQPSEAGSPLNVTVYNSIYSQALSLVENDAMVLSVTTPNGHMHVLRSLNPDIIYLQESLSGDKGSYVTQLQTWYRYDVIVVVGAEGGSGGIADSESEAEREAKVIRPRWWQNPDRVARGKGVVVVDGPRLGDDWLKRLEGQ
ncbi:hypothetical protein CFIMG_000084RA [Ceratocystis fimbriata CBS 114723]|uniref:Peroxin 22-like protein n=1 Tax=Ceratocystis fimbriata CBS 114723 TaxID=1035309 RepID=A0A2C5XGD1_9PEZI|nr:hypothetical protein CFIMG_000084RA [Ceratocystis fimbriata CBS 114723]